MRNLRRLIFIGAAAIVLVASGCSSTPKQMRVHPAESTQLGDSFYIEAPDNARGYSCSFVEFDGRGDYLDFQQHTHCYNRIKELAREDEVPLLLVVYCHGWKNGAQSADVVRFNHFLSRLAKTKGVAGQNYRVHGVFLSWQGNVVKPYVDKNSEAYTVTSTDFGAPILDPGESRKWKIHGWLRENLSYWNRKAAAEHYVSGIPIARSIFTYAGAAKQKTRDGEMNSKNKVFVMGHSFGALMMEQSLAHAMVGSISGQWLWGEKEEDRANQADLPAKPYLPFDLVLLVNSAAPSIYAKELQLFMAANKSATDEEHPTIISLTSTSDNATRKAHRLANTFARWYPSLRRKYDSGVLKPIKNHQPIHQSYYYQRTPGHNPLLINRWIESTQSSAKVVNTSDAVLAHNISAREDTHAFLTSNKKGDTPDAWEIVGPETKDIKWKGSDIHYWPSGYWIMSCGPALIKNHGDVWNDNAMECYAALYRLTAFLKREDK